DVDPVLLRALTDHGVHWDEIEVRIHGERWRCGGNGMAAIARMTLLRLLHEQAVAAGVDLRFEHDVPDPAALAGDYDLVVGADGANSAVRRHLEAALRPSVTVASAKFIWLATTKLFDGLTFIHERGPDGVFAVHGYPFGPDASTFIVETDEASWRRPGLDAFAARRPPVAKIQGAAGPSLSWWEHFGRYHDHLGAAQFAFHFFSRAIPLDKLSTRDPRFVADVADWWMSRFGAPPLSTPLSVGGRKLDGRVVSVTAPADGAAVPVVRSGGEALMPFRRPGE